MKSLLKSLYVFVATVSLGAVLIVYENVMGILN